VFYGETVSGIAAFLRGEPVAVIKP
jgi:hypothetical protein